MSHVMTARERDRYLAQKKAQVLRRLLRLLKQQTPEDMAALSPEMRAWFAEVLDRMPEEIPDDLLVPLRAALGVQEVAA